MDAIRHGIAKINIGTAIRQPYEALVADSVAKGQDAVYRTMLTIIRDDLEIENSASLMATQH
jgi:fructose-bisphosphate aldolase class II